MGTVFVQFSDDDKTSVVSSFGGPQDEEQHPHQGELDESDARYVAFIKPASVQPEVSPIDKLKAFLAANPDVALILQ